MRFRIGGFIAFIVGAGAGAAGSYIYLNKKMTAEFEKKRDEMIEYYQHKTADDRVKGVIISPQEVEPVQEERVDMMEQAKKLSSERGYVKYQNYSDDGEPPVVDESLSPAVAHEEPVKLEPYILDDDREFGDQEEYDIETWHVYEDGVVTNNEDKPMSRDEIENYIGMDAVARSENTDAVYIRNERLKTDYELIVETGRYTDA